MLSGIELSEYTAQAPTKHVYTNQCVQRDTHAIPINSEHTSAEEGTKTTD